LGKANDPLLPAASFDAVLISHAYHEMTEHAEMLAHIREALKPTGRLVVIEALQRADAISREMDRRRSTNFLQTSWLQNCESPVLRL
jgi:ubiquinone/menaquinone biosynthesis C-methylase UbiE